MRTKSHLTVVCVAFATCLFAYAGLPAGEASVDPLNSKNVQPAEQPMLEVRYSGGFRPAGAPPSRPHVRIFEDGRVIAGFDGERAAASHWRMPEDDLKQLVKTIAEQHKFFELTSDEIQREIEATGEPVLLADGLTTEIELRLDGRRHHVQVYALNHVLRQYQEYELEALQRAAVVAGALDQVATLATVGGPEKLEEYLAKITAHVRQENPDLPPIVAHHVTRATRLLDGTLRLHFGGQGPVRPGVPIMRFTGSLVEDPQGNIEVSVNIY